MGIKAPSITAAFLAAALTVSSAEAGPEQPVLAGATIEQQALPDVQGLPYGEARQIILDSGWQSIGNTEPDELMFSAADMYDQGYVEVDICSPVADSPCMFDFQNENGQFLRVFTTGEDPHVRSLDVQDASPRIDFSTSLPAPGGAKL